MTARAEQVARNEQSILDALIALWLEMPIAEITLEQVAERSGVTVRTILRKYGSKEGLIEASLERAPGNLLTRSEAPSGDIDEALNSLLQEYEAMGPAVIRTIAIEEQYPAARKILEKGRVHHRDWCAQVFSACLPEPGTPAFETKLTAFITATEIYLWKLLRKDLGKSREETLQVFRMLVEGLCRS